MKNRLFRFTSFALFLPVCCFMILGCVNGAGPSGPETQGGNFHEYWYQGKAEISSYKLTQARYGDLHEGKAVFVYVTEDFSDKDHHKINDPVADANELVPILKLNMTKDFNTGIYPYSLMKSVFKPVDMQKNPHALRVTGSMQEWCGHAFTQLDYWDNRWKGKVFSYFESEGDSELDLEGVWQEDELWVQLRLDPKKLPQGEIKLIPAVFYQRLSHRPFAVESANATLKMNEGEFVYTLQYTSFNRTLEIHFQADFPYQVQSWTDTYKSGWGDRAKELTTRGELDKTLMLDYWNKNAPSDTKYRKQLNLN